MLKLGGVEMSDDSALAAAVDGDGPDPDAAGALSALPLDDGSAAAAADASSAPLLSIENDVQLADDAAAEPVTPRSFFDLGGADEPSLPPDVPDAVPEEEPPPPPQDPAPVYDYPLEAEEPTDEPYEGVVEVLDAEPESPAPYMLDESQRFDHLVHTYIHT